MMYKLIVIDPLSMATKKTINRTNETLRFSLPGNHIGVKNAVPLATMTRNSNQQLTDDPVWEEMLSRVREGTFDDGSIARLYTRANQNNATKFISLLSIRQFEVRRSCSR